MNLPIKAKAKAFGFCKLLLVVVCYNSILISREAIKLTLMWRVLLMADFLPNIFMSFFSDF